LAKGSVWLSNFKEEGKMRNKRRVFLGAALAFGFFVSLAFAAKVNTTVGSQLGIYAKQYDQQGSSAAENPAVTIGQQLNIYVGSNNQTRPAIAYDSVNNRFLTVWQDEAPGNCNIYGQLINGDGTLFGGTISISTADYHQSEPYVAFDATSQAFLVVWGDNREEPGPIGMRGYRVYGQLLSKDGNPVGDNFAIGLSFDPRDRSKVNGFPRGIVFDSPRNRFLVLYRQSAGLAYSTPASLFGQFVNSNGALSGGSFLIADDVTYTDMLGYDSNQGRFLAAYDRYEPTKDAFDFYGQFVNSDGTLAGQEFLLLSSRSVELTSLAFDPLQNRFLLVWTGPGYNNAINCRLIDANGTPYGQELRISGHNHACGGKAVFDAINKKFLVTGYKYNSYGLQAIFGQWINPDGSPCGGNFDIELSTGDIVTCFGSGALGSLVVWKTPVSAPTGNDILARLVRVTSTTGSISGRVTREDGVTPIANIYINVEKYSGGEVTIPAQADGTYRITGLEPGDYRVRIFPPYGFGGEYYNETDDYGRATPVIVQAGQETQNINFTLPLGGKISGYVYEADGVTPAAGENVGLRKADGSRYGFGAGSNQDGSYSINVAYGDYKVYAGGWHSDFSKEYYDHKPLFETADTVTVANGSDRSGVNFKLDYGLSLSGLVLDKNLNRLPSVLVRWHANRDAGSDSYSNAAGKFFFGGMSNGVIKVEAWPDISSGYVASGYFPGYKIYLSGDENIKNHPLICLDGALATGYIKDAAGNPIASAEYWAGSRNLDLWGRTDSNGRYQLRMPLGKHWISFDEDSLERSALPQEITVTDTTQPIALPDITLYDASTGVSLSGQIINTGGFSKENKFEVGVFNAAMPIDINSFYGLSSIKNVEVIEGAGPFNFPSLPPSAAYQVLLTTNSSSRTFPEYVSVRDIVDNLSVPATGVNLTYSSTGGTIQGKVLDSVARPVLGAQVLLFKQSDNRFMGYAASNENGDYKLYNFQPGAYNVIVTHPKYTDSLPVQITVTDGQTVTLGNFILTSAEEQSLRNDYAAIENSFAGKDINAVMQYFSDNFIDQGETKASVRNGFLDFFNGHSNTSIKFDIKSLAILDGRALVKCDFLRQGSRNSDNKVLKDTWKDQLQIWRKENGIWKLYGNQDLFDSNVQVAYFTDNQQFMLDFYIYSQPGEITAASVSGPGIGTLQLYNDGQHHDGEPGGGEWANYVNLGIVPPAIGTEYTFNIANAVGKPIIRKATIANIVKKAATLVSPNNGVSVSGSPLFKWIEVPIAWNYYIEVYKGGGTWPMPQVWSYDIYGKKNTQTVFEEGNDAQEPLQNGQVYSWRIMTEDQNGNWACGRLNTFTYTNQAPALSPIGNKTVSEGQAITFTVSATDPDNDSLEYSAAGLPQGATFNPATRTFSWTPAHSQIGTYNNLIFTVSDGNLLDSEPIIITVASVLPETYEQWKAQKFTPEQQADPNISGETADPDHDGIQNLYEYAFNLDPLSADSSAYQYYLLNNHFTIKYRKIKSARDLTYRIGVKPDLFSPWEYTSCAISDIHDIDANTQLVTATDSVDSMTVTMRFFKLEVIRQGGQAIVKSLAFNPAQAYFSLGVAKSQSGRVTSESGKIDCGAQCYAEGLQGTTETLIAQPSAGYRLDSWTGACSGASAECVVRYDSQKQVGALFVPEDTTSPVTNITYKPAYTPGTWIRQPLKISLSAADNSSGVGLIRYSLDGRKPALRYTVPITLTKPGVYTLKYSSLDNAGNEEATKNVVIKIDLSVPIIIPAAPILKVAPGKPVLVNTTIIDAGSGVKSALAAWYVKASHSYKLVWIKKGLVSLKADRRPNAYKWALPVVMAKNQLIKYQIVAVDNAGNSVISKEYYILVQ